MEKMTSLKQVVSLVAVFAFAILSIASVSAFGYIDNVEVSGVDVLSGPQIAVFAGENVPVKVVFYAWEDATDVRVKAWIAGEQGYSVSTNRFDMVGGQLYTRSLSVEIPENIDPDENLILEVLVESREYGVANQVSIFLGAQRDSYEVEILDVDMNSKVKAGENLALDVIVKNDGRQLAEDTFVVVKIPALGIEEREYFGDISPEDQIDPERDDAVQNRINLAIPSDALSGVYVVEIRAYNSDFDETVMKKVAIVGASEDTIVLSSVSSKNLAVDETEDYTVTVVNTGSKVRVYDLVFETLSGLTFDVSDPVVVVPAGTSNTVQFEVSASKVGRHNFALNVYSDGQLVKRQDFVANVEEGNGIGFAGNATVLLTVILAIIFVVLLIVLIVLLTRKPEKVEEFGESYY